MLIKNKTGHNVRIANVDFKVDETKSYPDSLEVPKGFEVVEKPKVKHVEVVETVELESEPKVEEVKPKKKASKKKSKKD